MSTYSSLVATLLPQGQSGHYSVLPGVVILGPEVGGEGLAEVCDISTKVYGHTGKDGPNL